MAAIVVVLGLGRIAQPSLIGGSKPRPMTNATRQRDERWLLPFLAALVAVLATVFGAGTASAATTSVAETRVGASAVAVEGLVEPPERKAAGQRLGEDVAGRPIVVATGVAAKNGDDLTRVGRWMGDDELAKMQKSGLVQEGGGGRTFVTNPADPAAFPAGKGVFAEFNVPSNSLFPAGKPEWSVIPGPNVTTRLFGTPPSRMPPATCIVVVCRR